VRTTAQPRPRARTGRRLPQGSAGHRRLVSWEEPQRAATTCRSRPACGQRQATEHQSPEGRQPSGGAEHDDYDGREGNPVQAPRRHGWSDDRSWASYRMDSKAPRPSPVGSVGLERPGSRCKPGRWVAANASLVLRSAQGTGLLRHRRPSKRPCYRRIDEKAAFKRIDALARRRTEIQRKSFPPISPERRQAYDDSECAHRLSNA
jgi:hypothetical protein